MTQGRLAALQERVRRVLDQAELAEEPEAKADLACLACILTSATIEVACREYVGRYVEKRASPTVTEYVRARLYYFQNGKVEDIDKLLREFSPSLADRFLEQIGDERRDAIDSTVNRKNELVHGKGSGIGLDTMKRYHTDVLSALETLRDLLTDPGAT